MPLHTITAVHGEAGPRERLAIEIAGFPRAGRERAGGNFQVIAEDADVVVGAVCVHLLPHR